MKESITKFDLEAAFKALDEIDTPIAKGIKANRPALTEIFSRKTKFDALMEEYYDVGNMDELGDAKTAREAEVAKAKLARIEKIVDLDAESPEDLLPSYVGKFIIQCPQCMTLFYKNPEDVEASEEDPDVVNINEVCQHCGNDAGYSLIGKVGEATEEEQAEVQDAQEIDVDSTEDSEEESADEATEEPEEDSTESADEADELNLDELLLDDDETSEDSDKKEESHFIEHGGDTLVEDLQEDAELDVSADDFEKLINSPEFKSPITDKAAEAMLRALDKDADKDATSDTDMVKEGLRENAIRLYDEQDVLSDHINSMMRYGKFLYASWVKDAPTVKEINKSTYKVIHPKGGAEVTVEFDMSNTHDATLKFTVDGKFFETRSMSAAQNFVLAELEKARVKSFDLALDESAQVNNEILRYAVINADGTYAGVPCTSYEEARELAAAGTGRVIVELGDVQAPLEEGVFDRLKDTFANVVDKAASKFKTREAKADWILKNAKEDYNKVKIDENGEPIIDEANQRFSSFIVVGFTNKFNNGRQITIAPSYKDTDLVVGMSQAQEKASYKEAEDIAKGWSMTQGNGPAFIYFAKGKDDPKAVFLCEYFEGKIEYDFLEKYFNAVKDSLKGAKLMARGGMSDEAGKDGTSEEKEADIEETIDSAKPAESTKMETAKEEEVVKKGTTKRIDIADLKQGMFVLGLAQIPEMKLINGIATEILSRDQNKDNFVGVPSKIHYIITFEGIPELPDQPPEHALGFGPNDQLIITDKINVIEKQKQEGLKRIMHDVEDLHEATLEKCISDSLIESYGNVAGFRLAECTYENNKFTVAGTILFTSGNKRETSYVFSEALTHEGKVNLRGMNEKLGLDKLFTITGYAKNKTFITESFKVTKK